MLAARSSGSTSSGIRLAVSILGLGDVLTPLEREGCRLADAGRTVVGSRQVSAGSSTAS